MLYVTHAQEATACSQTLLLSNFLREGPCLAVVKHSCISFLSLVTPNGSRASTSTALLEEIQTVDINARILSVQTIDSVIAGEKSQVLLVLTDHYQPRIVALSASLSNAADNETRISTQAVLPLNEPARLPAETALGLWVEPCSEQGGDTGNRVAVCHAYKGTMRVMPRASSTARASPVASRMGIQDTIMAEASVIAAACPIDFSQSFGVRLPHPNLLSCALLWPSDAAGAPILALLSLSSLPSRIPGLGEQCMPVLSFHSIDLATQELSPLPWGPQRKPPRQQATAPSAEAESGGPSAKGDKDQARKQHGPSAMGLKLDSAALSKREEAWAASELAQAHVPLPTADAVGAHLIHTIPAGLGGGVIVFGENSVLYVPPPEAKAAQSSQSLSQTASKGKRRKASTSSSVDARRLSTSDKSVEAEQPRIATTSAPANENGKRRRSSAATQAFAMSPPSSPTATRSLPSQRSRLKLLRVSLPYPMQIVAAVSVLDSDNKPVLAQSASSTRPVFTVLFGTSSGHLNALRIALSDNNGDGLDTSATRPCNMRVERLGEISQPAGPHGLTYLGDGLVQVSSSTGDSALYKIEPAVRDVEEVLDEQMMTPPSSPTQTRSSRPRAFSTGFTASAELPIGGSLMQVRKWDNLGPIVDFIVDDGSGGNPALTSGAQARIVTCSGSGPSGSLRVVRNGVSVQDFTSIKISDASRVWAVNHASPSLTTSALVLGFPTATSLLVFGEDGGLMDVTPSLSDLNIRADAPTLAAASVQTGGGSLFLHVQAYGATLSRVDGSSMSSVHAWSPDKGIEITAASANIEGQLLLALSDNTMVYMLLTGAGLALKASAALDQQVSCLNISSLSVGQQATYAACGFWTTHSVQIYTLPDLKPVAQQSVAKEALSSVPRSILLHQFGSAASPASRSVQPHLLIGLGDGTLVSYSLSLPTADAYSQTVGMSDCKTVSLGSKALSIDAIETQEGLRAVAVAGSRSCIVYADAKRFSYNTIRYKDLSCVTTLHPGVGQNLHLLVLKDMLQLCAVGALQRRDIQTVPLGLEQPLAIAAWQQQRAFAVCTWTFLPRGTATVQSQPRGCVQILDQNDFRLLDQLRLDADERPNCVNIIPLQDHTRGLLNVLVVGTGYMAPGSTETTSGRLLGFEMQSGNGTKGTTTGTLRKLFENRVSGNVYSIVGVGFRLVAAVNSEVMLFDVHGRPSPNGLLNLKQTGSWASSFIACNLSVVRPDCIIVGDALRSMNILRVVPGYGNLEEIARDCDPFWTTAAELVDEASQTFIGADISFNMYTTQRVHLSEQVKKRIKLAKDSDLESGRRPLPTSNASTAANDEGFAHVMQRRAVWHYGDMINKFLRASLVSDPGLGHIGVPKLLFCTASGAIGVLTHVDDTVAQLLTAVERNTIQLIESTATAEQSATSTLPRSTGTVGGIAYQDWRTLRTDHRTQAPAGFLDGKILNMWVNGRLSREQISEILAGPDSDAYAIAADRETVQRYIDALAQIS